MSLSRTTPPIRTKICGITNTADALMAIDAGADALGFNFYAGSKRFLDFEAARPWLEPLQGKVDRVAVVVNASPAELAVLRDSGCFEWIQFHGDETQSFCENEGGANWIKAYRVKNRAALDAALAFKTKYMLVDGWKEGVYGGSGARLNWDIMRDFVLMADDRKVILAGGLTPHNVRDSIRIVRPHAVDVASGVELESGRKNEYLVREFIRVAISA